MVCDLRPLQSVEGTGFIQLVQTAINIGATHGSCSAESLVPSRKTVKQRMSAAKEKVTDNLKETLSSAINQYGIQSVYFTENSGYRSLKNRSCVTVFSSCSVTLTVGEPLGDVSDSANHDF